jgi:cell division septation protein DedD
LAAPEPTAPAKTATGGSWKIQLAAVKTEAGARQEWGRMQKAHLDLLGDMRLTVQKADLGTKGIFFRIQAGPLPDRTTAEDVCAELKASKQPCIVVKP